MTLVQAVDKVGRVAWLVVEEISIGVEVKDVKQAYGRFRFLVTPITGHGEQWVDEVRLKWEGGVDNARR